MITVEITASELVACHPMAVESMILGRLHKAGVPVKGVLLFGGLERGMLERRDNFDNNIEYVFTDEPPR